MLIKGLESAARQDADEDAAELYSTAICRAPSDAILKRLRGAARGLSLFCDLEPVSHAFYL